MPEQLLSGGGILAAAIGGVATLVVKALLVWLKGRGVIQVAEIGQVGAREGRSLEAEHQAFGHLREALEDARAEVDALERELTGIRRTRDEAIADAANVRTITQTTLLRNDIEKKHLLRENAHLRRMRVDLWNYAMAVYERATVLRDECALVVRVIPEEVRRRFPDFGVESLRKVEPPAEHLRPEPEPQEPQV